jgi:hypothetical protein
LEVPTIYIYKAYVREYPHLYGTVPPFQDPEIPIEHMAHIQMNVSTYI